LMRIFPTRCEPRSENTNRSTPSGAYQLFKNNIQSTRSCSFIYGCFMPSWCNFSLTNNFKGRLPFCFPCLQNINLFNPCHKQITLPPVIDEASTSRVLINFRNRNDWQTRTILHKTIIAFGQAAQADQKLLLAQNLKND
jgi:hypothetical protein